MADTVRTDAAILALLADNEAGDISAQDLRDAYVSLQTPEYMRYNDHRMSDETAHTDDEFFNGTPTGTDVDHAAGTFVSSEARGRLSQTLVSGAALTEVYATAFPITATSAPVTMETTVDLEVGHDLVTAYGIAWGFSDGTALTSNIMGRVMRVEADGGGIETWNMGGTFATAALTAGVNDHHQTLDGPLYLRAGWTAASTFSFNVSNNSDLWIPKTWVDLSEAHTPTHVWVGMTNNQANLSVATWDYIRINDSDLMV